MRVLRRRWLPLAVLAACLAPLLLLGQGPELGAFSGTVRDEQGRPMAGATVVFRGIDFNLRREIQTDRDGRFYYGGFQPGRYHIAVLREGRILWSLPVTLSHSREVLQLEIDLQKLRQAAGRVQHLDPELERQREADRQRREHEEHLQEYLNRGLRHLNDAHPERALEEFQAALELEPSRGGTYALLGAAYAAADRRPEAMDSYRRALELEPGEGAHHNNLAILLVRSGQLEEALAQFGKAAQLDPDRAATYQFNSGATLLNAGRPADALSALRLATRRDPTFAVAHYFLGLALLRTSPRRSPEGGPERIEPRPGTLEAFQRYLQLAPDGEYAESAREYLKQLGAGSPQLLLPALPPGGNLE